MVMEEKTPRNGSGGYSLPEPPFVFDTVIDETAVNNNYADIGAEITNSIAADGQTTPTANLKMGNRIHTGVGNASARDNYAAVGQIQDNAFLYAGDAGGTANALVLNVSPNVTANVEGQEVLFKAVTTNTAAVTVQVGGAPAVAGEIDGASLTGGEIIAGKLYRTVFDGVATQLSRVSFIGLQNVVEDTSPQLGGVLDANGQQIRQSRGSNVTAATSTVIPDDGNQFTVLGNTEIEGLSGGGDAGTDVTLIFNGTPNLKHGSNFSLPGAADIQAAANDIAVFTKVNDVTQAWFCSVYTKADGTAVVGGEKASKSEIETEAAVDKYIPPDLAKHIPGAAKGLITFNGSLATAGADLTGVLKSYNVTSLVRVSAGVYTINWTTAFADADYHVFGAAKAAAPGNSGNVSIDDSVNPTTTSLNIQVNDANGNALDSTRISVAVFGDQ